MTFGKTLLVSASALALITPAAVQAKRPTRHAAAGATSAQLEEMRKEIEDLKARLDAAEAAQHDAATSAASAQEQAAAAATQAQAAATQAQAAQAQATQVATAQADDDKTVKLFKSGWFNNTSISGRMYFNFSNIDQKSNGAKTTATGTGFNIKRFYLGVDHKFNDVFSGNLTTDISDVAGTSGNLVGRGLYVKKAYLQAKLNPALIIRLGSADMPWIPYAENQYGYRHIENTLIDRTSFGTSADWGIHVLGDLAGGLLSYQVSVVDGGGYRNVKVTKSVDVEGRVSAQYKGFYAAVGGYSGKRAADVQNAVTHHTATRIDGLVGYKNKMFNLGAEYFHTKDWNQVTTVAEEKADGYSIFANVNFHKNWSVFGRYDWVKPTKLANDNLKDQYFNVGLQWEPVKIVDLALVYKRDKVENGTFGTSNGTIGGANPVGSLVGGRGTYDEVGLFGQLRF